MNSKKFLEDLKEILGEEINSLDDIIEPDSLNILALIAYIDEHFGKTIDYDKFNSIKTVRDLIRLIGEEHFE